MLRDGAQVAPANQAFRRTEALSYKGEQRVSALGHFSLSSC